MQFKIRDFTWDNNIGSVEISDLGLDRLTQEIYIQGKTNKKFVFSHELRDGEGDVMGWVYYSECNNYKVTIFND